MNRFFVYVFLFGVVVSALPSLMQGRTGEESIPSPPSLPALKAKRFLWQRHQARSGSNPMHAGIMSPISR